MTEQTTTAKVAPETIRRLVLVAVVATIALTVFAFWLSYEHLHDVAHGHGLPDVRSWFWPATVDLFIAVGEISILIASLYGRSAKAAIFVTVVGSIGSIALNVAGVGTSAAVLTYVVAAVPPTAALLSFGILMRQLKEELTEDQQPADETGADATQSAASGTTGALEDAALERHESVYGSAPESAMERPAVAPQSAPGGATESATASATEKLPQRHESAAQDATVTARKRAKKTPRKRAVQSPRDAAKEAIKALYGELGRRPIEPEMVAALKAIKCQFDSPAFAKKIRAEIERDEPHLAALGSDNVRPLTGS